MSSHARSIKHGSFVIERTFNYDPAALFRAWTDPEPRRAGSTGRTTSGPSRCARWTCASAAANGVIGKFVDGSESRFEALYFDVVPERRLVYTYDMYWQGKKISVSLASVEFVALGKENGQSTKLIVTEQHAFLDGYEDGGSRERGTLGAHRQPGSGARRRRLTRAAAADCCAYCGGYSDPRYATMSIISLSVELFDHGRHLLRGVVRARVPLRNASICRSR